MRVRNLALLPVALLIRAPLVLLWMALDHSQRLLWRLIEHIPGLERPL